MNPNWTSGKTHFKILTCCHIDAVIIQIFAICNSPSIPMILIFSFALFMPNIFLGIVHSKVPKYVNIWLLKVIRIFCFPL